MVTSIGGFRQPYIFKVLAIIILCTSMVPPAYRARGVSRQYRAMSAKSKKARPTLQCSGQPIPDSGLSFSSATAGGNPSLN
ncbi:hypothetical protein APB52_32795 [Pseudomonas aeruginosa]|nr:hypothetical protein AO933_34290 [Pseudomonas aeruginosa]OPE02008.1 hypothetical protein APA28_30840 [Pseudomonas aeruginosa]OPE12300.1 hypothetical protein APA59_34435 [Pseudomonas aeruginosa]OPE37223.1 hypothetical protein APB52_32795 [Pseudomonas aeruginosa]